MGSVSIFTRADKRMTEIFTQLSKNEKRRYGVYKKCVCHLHTPASYDFYFDEAWKGNNEKYSKMDANDIFNKIIKEEIIPEDTIKIDEMVFDNIIFKDLKEYLTYFLIAYKLSTQDIEMVIVTDHNTIEGISKLREAIKEYKKFRTGVYTEVICGIEITCADKTHVVGMFRNDDIITSEVSRWLKEYMVNKKLGTYLTSIQVLEKIHQLDGIGYIAHIDISDIFHQDYLSGAFKKSLFSIPYMNVVGVSDKNKAEITRKRIEKLTKKEFCFLVDEDSHSIETIGTKVIWIKGVSNTYDTIKKAVRDYNISIELDKPREPLCYIKGIYAANNGSSFLVNNTNYKEDFSVTFSNSLNCFIGGRGTGKSTTLHILDFVLGQNFRHEEELDSVCNYKDIWVLYYYNNVDYLVLFNVPQKSYKDQSIVDCFLMEKKFSFFEHEEVKNAAIDRCIQIFELKKFEDRVEKKEIYDIEKYLSLFFDTKFSVNDLVQMTDDYGINSYIYNAIVKNKNCSKLRIPSPVYTKKGVSRYIKNIESILTDRRAEINSLINDYNLEYENEIQIKYYQVDKISKQVQFQDLFDIIDQRKDKLFYNYNITWDNLCNYFNALINKIGLISLISHIVNSRFNELNEIIKLQLYCEEKNYKLLDREVIFIDDDISRMIFFKLVEEKLITKNIKKFIIILKKYMEGVEHFDIEFNINNREKNEQSKPIFRSIRCISMGQKVVAMLSFIISYSKYSSDYRPLIIDQPEDNLDNQYIYKNLVRQLRMVKSERQIIIATHSATIVTNAKAEQVIVMESNNEHGWVSCTGYPNDKKIINHIVNYLEGGRDSFLHKSFLYGEVLNK